MPSKPKQPDDDHQHEGTARPTESQHDGEITCKGYGPVQPVDGQDEGAGNEGEEDTSSPKEIR